MNSTGTENDEQSLDRLLGVWKLDADLPEGFRSHIWQRIAQSQPLAPLSFWSALLVWLEQCLRQPGRAITSIALFFLLGLFAGYLHVRAEHTAASNQMSTRYVQQVDPYQTIHR